MNVCYRTDALAWHVAYTAPQAEGVVADGIKAIGLDCYVPVSRCNKVVRRRRVEIERPLFSRYVFFGVPGLTPWRDVLDVDGVEDVLRNNDVPSRLPVAWIDTLRKMEGAGAFDKRPDAAAPFKIGEVVRISDGPFSGLNATVQAFMTKLRNVHADRRARVLLDFLGRQTAIEIELVALESV